MAKQYRTLPGICGPLACTSLFAVLLCCGCAPKDAPPVQRLAGALAPGLPQVPPALTLPMDDTWQAHDAEYEVTEAGLGLVCSGEPDSGVLHEVDFDASMYNVVEVRMQVSAGRSCILGWQGNLSPLPIGEEHVPQSSWPIFTDGQMHTYRWRLGEQEYLWAGAISHLFLSPSDEDAEAVIASVRLLYEKPDAPHRIRLGTQTMDAYFGTQPPWRLTLPEGAVFETHLGMLPQAWMDKPYGQVRFEVLLRAAGDAHTVYERLMMPAQTPAQREWVRVECDLNAYAGKDVTLELNIDPCGIPFGDYAFWGNPMVYTRTGAPPRKPPVILISCDTLRADHLSCYGYERDTTPNLDRFAREDAVLFENAISPHTYTLPAHMSMWTGLHQRHHNTTNYLNLAESVLTLPEMLRDAGYVTAGFTGHDWWLLGKRGFAQGLDLYDVPISVFRHIYATWDPMMAWLSAHQHVPFFLFFHNYDIHEKFDFPGQAVSYKLPYDPGDDEFRPFSAPLKQHHFFSRGKARWLEATRLLEAQDAGVIEFSPEAHAYLKALYDDCILLVDHRLGLFFDHLRREGLYDNAMIIVTADHGEEMNEHGVYLHNTTRESVCRVPLLVKFPGGAHAATRYAPQVSLVDLFATVRDALGLPAHQDDGNSLLALLEGRASPREWEYTERLAWRSMRSNTWKLHHVAAEDGVVRSLYNLEADPLEREEAGPEMAEELDGWSEQLNRHYSLDAAPGWHFRLVNQAPWDASLELRSDASRITCVFPPHLRNAVHSVVDNSTVSVTVSDAETAELVVRTSSADAKLQVSISAACGFRVCSGAGCGDLLRTWEGTLVPTDPDLTRVPAGPGAADPAILIWRVAQDGGQTAAERPDAERTEQLRALGYLE